MLTPEAPCGVCVQHVLNAPLTVVKVIKPIIFGFSYPVQYASDVWLQAGLVDVAYMMCPCCSCLKCVRLEAMGRSEFKKKEFKYIQCFHSLIHSFILARLPYFSLYVIYLSSE